MGIMEEYRRQGIDALLYLETLKVVFAKGYEWLDGSLPQKFKLREMAMGGGIVASSELRNGGGGK